MRRAVCIVPTGSANIASVRAAFERLGAVVHVAASPNDARHETHVVLPGVGAFGAAAQRLADGGFLATLRRRFESGWPTLGICLGMQLLAAASEESPGAAGLGVAACRVERFPGTLRVPHMGWNRVRADPASVYLEPGHAYFANSYRIATPPAAWCVSWAEYDGPFAAAIERGAVLGCQFHPELSGAWGLALLEAWLDRSSQAMEVACSRRA